jgi:MinD-like ATPase involved in chromosome partitioning or flagellar assembly
MASCIAFHSYKGGTGKTTIAANLAALLAKKGYRVFLLDLDVYAPSLHSYFNMNPKRWINDFLNGSAEVGDIIVDVTSALADVPSAGEQEKIKGKLWLGFSSPRKEEIYRLEGGSGKQETSKIQLLRRFILLREQLISLHDADYIIIDTSPGIRYWSINALAVADTLFLTLKMGDLDIEGTRKMAEEIYGSFTKFGARSYLVMNRVAGYCTPIHVTNKESNESHAAPSFGYNSMSHHSDLDASAITNQQKEELTITANSLATDVRMDVISSIACYCDIQFTNKEFLTAIKYPAHPFAHRFEELIRAIEEMQKRS